MFWRKTTINHFLSEFFVFLLIASDFNSCSNVLSFAAATNIKYTHGALPRRSALTGRVAQDFESSDNVVSGVVEKSGGDSSNGVSVNSDLDGSAAVNGGEVFVPKTFQLSPQEPTCEQLRAMWIFSKRQSRAAEMTNEIPTYRDPFAYNVWDPFYASARSLGTVRVIPRERSRSPVFGRVVSREPVIPQRISAIGQRQRHFGGNSDSGTSSRIYAETKPFGNTALRRPTQNRYIGSGGNGQSSPASNGNSVAVQGSFQKLKELIWTERAKELTQQRRAEELAARAAVLKEIANGQNVKSSYKHQNYKSDSPLMDENRSPDHDENHFMNDGRISIANGQLRSDNDNKITADRIFNKASTRSYVNRGGGGSSGQKTSLFSGKAISGDPSLSHILRPSSSYAIDDETISGIPKSYPIRSSHFRERNRSLYQQLTPTDFFQRNIRNLNNAHNMLQGMNQHIVENYSEPDAPNFGNDGFTVSNIEDEDELNNYVTKALDDFEPKLRTKLYYFDTY